MRIVIITQNEPFYLAENLDGLFSNLPSYVEIAGCIVSSVSPFGTKESFLQKAMKTRRIFGTRFFLHYATRFVRAKLNPAKSVLKVLERHGFERIELEGSINSRVSLKRIGDLHPDLLISIAGNEIFRKPLLELAPKGCLNLHTSLLPKYRGLMPSFWVLRNQEKETGVSVFFVDEGIDSGAIIVQKRIEVMDLTQEELIRISKRIGMDAIKEAIELIHSDSVKLIPNNDAEKTYYSFPTRDDVMAFLAAGARFY